MNRFSLWALSCLASGACFAAATTTVPTIVSTVNSRLKTGAQSIHTTLIEQLRTRRKDADKHEGIELRQAQKAKQLACNAAKKELQQECALQKRALSAEYAQDKAARKALYKQVVTGLSTAKRSAHAPAKTLGMLLDNVEGYIGVLHDHAQTAQMVDLVRQLHDEHRWVRSLRDTAERSGIELETPLKKARTRTPKKERHKLA